MTSDSSSSMLTGGGENAPHLEACSASDRTVKQGRSKEEGRNQRSGLSVARFGMYKETPTSKSVPCRILSEGHGAIVT